MTYRELLKSIIEKIDDLDREVDVFITPESKFIAYNNQMFAISIDDIGIAERLYIIGSINE